MREGWQVSLGSTPGLFRGKVMAGDVTTFRKHPSFDDFARGLMAIYTGLWRIEIDDKLQKRFPPRPLKGMTRSAFWAPPEDTRSFGDVKPPEPWDVRCHC